MTTGLESISPCGIDLQRSQSALGGQRAEQKAIYGEIVNALLQFLGVWGVWIALTVGTLLIVVWALSIDGDPTDEKVASSLIWSTFWPVIGVYLRLTGKNAARSGIPRTRPNASIASSNARTRERSTPRFRSVREAKEYLVNTIGKEAESSGTPLTTVERKMLYFTETGWTLPDMREISAEFDRDYDQEEYEEKIGSIIARINARLSDEGQQERTTWDLALDKLVGGDHYLLVLADFASPDRRGAKHNFKVLIIALVFFALAAVNAWFRNWLRNH